MPLRLHTPFPSVATKPWDSAQIPDSHYRGALPGSSLIGHLLGFLGGDFIERPRVLASTRSAS